jgi:hypothetical protein
MLDRLPALARHLVLTLAAVLLSWAGSDVVRVWQVAPTPAPATTVRRVAATVRR